MSAPTIDPQSATVTELAELQQRSAAAGITAATSYLPSDEEAARLIRQAEYLAGTDLVVRQLQGKPANIAFIMLIARALGMDAAWGLTRIYIVEGKPTLAAETMRALVLREGHHIHFQTLSSEQVVMVGWREGQEEWPTEVKWDLEDARRAGVLGKNTWKAFPQDMLTARCTTRLCRLIFPDVLMGMTWSPEDFDNYVDPNGKLVPAEAAALPERIPVNPDWFRDVVLLAFDDAAELPENHPYQGCKDAKEKLRALWAKLQDTGRTMDGVLVADLNGVEVPADDFFIDASVAAASGQPFAPAEPVEQAAAAGDGPGEQVAETVDPDPAPDGSDPDGDADAADAPEATPEESEGPTQTAEERGDRPRWPHLDVHPAPTVLADLWGTELRWQSSVLGISMNELAKRQLGMAQKTDVHDLPVRLLAKVVTTQRERTLLALRESDPVLAGGYGQWIAEAEVVGGQAPIPVPALMGRAG